MSDLPHLAPRPGQLEAALVQVRARRRRSVVRTTSAACALAVAVAVLDGSGPGGLLLEQTDQGARTATAVPSTTGHGGETDSSTGPRLATPPSPARAATALMRRPRPTSPGVSPRAVASEAQPRPRPAVVRTMDNAVVSRAEGPTPCTPVPAPPTMTGACGGLLYEKSAGEVMFQLSICSASEGYALEFATEQEIDLVVRSEDRATQHWWWGRGVEFAARPHTLLLGTEECVTWWLPWDYGDESGRRVPPGRYLVTLPVLSDPPSEYGYVVAVD